MKDILKFMSESPILTGFIILIAAITVSEVAKYIAYAFQRRLPESEKDEEDD